MPIKAQDVKTLDDYKRAMKREVRTIVQDKTKFCVYSDIILVDGQGKPHPVKPFLLLGADPSGLGQLLKPMKGSKKLVCRGTCAVSDNKIALHPVAGKVPYKSLKGQFFKELLGGKPVLIPTGKEEDEDGGEIEEPADAAPGAPPADSKPAAPAKPPVEKQAYDELLKGLAPKMAEARKKQYLKLAAQSDEITNLNRQMTGLAAKNDYKAAIEVAKKLEPKVTAYLEAASKQVEPPILGSAQSARADAVLKKMPEKDQKEVQKVMDEVESEPKKQFVLKGVAAGHNVKELEDFAKKIKGKDAKWMRNNLSLTGSSKGTGVMQQWSHSCNATTVQAVHAQMDPLYALKVHEQNPKLDQADNANATKKNPKLAEEQRSMLASAYHGSVADAGPDSGVAVARSAAGGSGRWADDLLNNVSDSTGVKYSTKKIGADMTVDQAVEKIDSGMSKGEPVPIVIGNASDSYTHYVLITGMEVGPPKQYTIHDPWSGKTMVRTEAQVKNGTLNIANSNQISAIEEPSEKAVP